jgi:hypothetical protein
MPTDRENLPRTLLILAVASFAVVILFIGFSKITSFYGFPLDDAWIHQVYARNLVSYGEWAFNPGQPSGGSTAPLWSILLAGGYVLSLDPVVWVGFIGWFLLAVLGLIAQSTADNWNLFTPGRIPWVGIFFIFEWHMVWASVSGMETLLFSLLALMIFWTLARHREKFWLAGLLTGLSTWVRPDGLTLLGPILFVLLFNIGNSKGKFINLSRVIGAFALFFLPYLIFNLHFSGDIWPSTFSAKQAEYRAGLDFPLFERIGNLFLPFLAGGGVILFPGFLASVWQTWKNRNWPVIALILWVTGFILLFSLRLPVNYQHGRYMMPAMAGYFLVGLIGMDALLQMFGRSRPGWILKRAWIFSLVSVTLVFLWSGMRAYRTDVAIIETEMVTTAKWIEFNTLKSDRIAAHDIGALGYFSGREIIDLAGLINPDVIPIIRDENKLGEYLNSSDIDYLVTFPGWYPELINGKLVVFSSGGTVSPLAGGENMVVLQWK